MRNFVTLRVLFVCSIGVDGIVCGLYSYVERDFLSFARPLFYRVKEAWGGVGYLFATLVYYGHH